MAEKINLGYRMIRSFAQFWVKRFFRRVQINGSLNELDGPIIFAMNHPNNLIDTLLVGYAIKRKIHYLATAQLFRNRMLSFFLHNVGVIPVYRKQDDPSHGEKNLAMFQACYEILEDAGAIGIYPEGTTHAEPRVKKIKTGAARIALETEQRYRCGIRLIPVGLNYSVRKSFRGDVVINIGTPLEITHYAAQYEVDPIGTVEQLTMDLQNALEQQVLHIEAPELDKLIKDIEEIYRGELIRDLVRVSGVSRNEINVFRLSKKLVEGVHFFNQRDPGRVLTMQQDVLNYKSKLQKVHLQDSMLQKVQENPVSYKLILLRIISFIAGFPLAFWGGINHFCPYQLTRWISRKIAKRETDYATVRILSAIVLYSIFYAFQIYAVLRLWGWTAALIYGCSLPFFGAFAYYYWEKFRIFKGDLNLFFVMLTRKQLLNQLKQRRERLISEMDAAKQDYLNAHLQA